MPLNEQNNEINQVVALDSSGSCGANGDNVTYTWDYDDSTITISGTGEMKNYTSSEEYGSSGEKSPFYNTTIKKIIIGYGVTSIGDYAFESTYVRNIEIGWDTTDNTNRPISVTRIGDGAFSFCGRLEKMYRSGDEDSSTDGFTILDGVTSIGENAFDGCFGEAYKIEKITIPDSVTSIGRYAFFSCHTLKNVAIGNGVTSIGDYAFSDCDLTSITIPASVTSIGDRYEAFNCAALTDIKINSGNEKYTSRGNDNSECNAIIEKASGNLIRGCKNTVIPNGVVSIEENAFWGCTGLTNVTIPASVKSIGYGAFQRCSGLTNVTICGATSIGDSAFYYCTSLTTVTMHDGVTSIGYGVFRECALTSVTIPASVKSIGMHAFYNCSSLTSVIINGKNTTIGSSAIPANTGMTIYGYSASPAETYASTKNITFVGLDVTVTFQVSFANETPKGGIFIYILRDNESGSGYAEFYSYYCDGNLNNQSIVYDLLKNATYRVVISKPYVWNFSMSGEGLSNTSFVNNKFIFTTTSNAGVVTIGTTGGTPPNAFTIV